MLKNESSKWVEVASVPISSNSVNSPSVFNRVVSFVLLLIFLFDLSLLRLTLLHVFSLCLTVLDMSLSGSQIEPPSTIFTFDSVLILVLLEHRFLLFSDFICDLSSSHIETIS